MMKIIANINLMLTIYQVLFYAFYRNTSFNPQQRYEIGIITDYYSCLIHEVTEAQKD